MEKKTENKTSIKEGKTNIKEKIKKNSQTFFLEAWKDLAQNILVNFWDNFVLKAENFLKIKTEEAVDFIQKSLLLIFLFYFGLGMMLVGAAKALDRLIKFDGAGFILVGFILFFIASLTKYLKSGKK